MSMTMMKPATALFLASLFLPPLRAAELSGAPGDAVITNGTDWVGADGRPIMAHEGDLARFDGVFYWYGSGYANNPQGRFDIADGPVWNGVQVYRSMEGGGSEIHRRRVSVLDFDDYQETGIGREGRRMGPAVLLSAAAAAWLRSP